MSHSVYERVIINSMLLDMDDTQLIAELGRAERKAETVWGGEHIVNTAHVLNVINHLIRRGVTV